MDVNTLISGFIGSFLGVASGFLGAVYLDWRHQRNERRTHILAVMREMLSNNVRIQLLLKESRREGALDDRAWRELRVPLAGQLPMEFYNRLASRYDSFITMRRIYDELHDAEEAGEDRGDDREKLRHWAAGMMEENELLRAEMGAAAGLVRALRRRERRRADRLANDGVSMPDNGGEPPVGTAPD